VLEIQAEIKLEQRSSVNVEPLILRSLTIREKKLGSDHPDTAVSYNNLALLRESEGDFRESERLFQRAIATLKKFSDSRLASVLMNFSRFYEKRGKRRRAAELKAEAEKLQTHDSSRHAS